MRYEASVRQKINLSYIFKKKPCKSLSSMECYYIKCSETTCYGRTWHKMQRITENVFSTLFTNCNNHKNKNKTLLTQHHSNTRYGKVLFVPTSCSKYRRGRECCASFHITGDPLCSVLAAVCACVETGNRIISVVSNMHLHVFCWESNLF